MQSKLIRDKRRDAILVLQFRVLYRQQRPLIVVASIGVRDDRVEPIVAAQELNDYEDLAIGIGCNALAARLGDPEPRHNQPHAHQSRAAFDELSSCYRHNWWAFS